MRSPDSAKIKESVLDLLQMTSAKLFASIAILGNG
jgi:hypothetical protein